MLYDSRVALGFDTVRIAEGHRALVVHPTAPIVVGRERLAALREQIAGSEADAQIIAQVRRFSPIHAFVFRGRSDDGRGYWRLADDLDASEAGELCALMFRAHLPLKRALLDAGSLDNIYIEWRPKEIHAFESGLRRLREALRQELSAARLGSGDARAIRLDLWLSERISLFSGATLRDTIDTLLPPRMRRREERLAHVRSLFG